MCEIGQEGQITSQSKETMISASPSARNLCHWLWEFSFFFTVFHARESVAWNAERLRIENCLYESFVVCFFLQEPIFVPDPVISLAVEPNNKVKPSWVEVSNCGEVIGFFIVLFVISFFETYCEYSENVRLKLIATYIYTYVNFSTLEWLGTVLKSPQSVCPRGSNI